MSDQQRLGRYIVEDQLGEGSFAWVYRGYDEELDRHVALKVLKPIWLSDPQAVNRFKQEARTMAKLHHPNIAVVYEVGEAEGQVFLAQFLVNGPTLAARLQNEGPMAWSETIDMLRLVSSALDYAHSTGMIHRDIKPANILVDTNKQAYLGDFGLVRAAEGSASISASTGGMVGTPAYMAPEQWEGKEVTPATDVYALSCVVFEMLTGKMLFDGATPATVMKQHLMEGPKFPEAWPADVPDRIAEVLKRGLAENAKERISSASELVTELEQAGEEQPVPPPAAPVEAGVTGAVGPTAPAMMSSKQTEPAPEVTAPPVDDSETLVEATAPAEAMPGPAAPAKKPGGKGLAIIGVVVAVVLLLIVGVVGLLLFSGGEGGEVSPAADSQSGEAVVVAPDDTPTEAPAEEEDAAAPEPPTDTPEPPTPTSQPPTPTPEPAESETESGAEDSDGNAAEFLGRGNEYVDQGEFEQAIAEYDQAIELDPELADAYDMRGWANYNLGNPEPALDDFNRAIELNSNEGVYYSDRGLAYAALEDYEQALADFDQAIELDPEEGDYYYNRAWIYENLEDYEQALANYTEGLARYQAVGLDDAEYLSEIETKIAELEAELGTAAAQAQPTEEPAAQSSSPTPTSEPTPTVTVANISGHIAIPLMAGNEPRVYVVDTDGNQVNVLGSARQPAHTLDGTKLVVNGDGGSQLLLRRASSDGSGASEFGNPTLSSHSHPAWSADGTEVVYLDRFGTQEYHMFKRSIDSTEGEGEELFAQGNGQIFHANPMYPQWATKGIVFRGCSTWTGQGGDCGVWLLQGQNGVVSRLTSEVNHIPTDVSGNTAVFSWNKGNWDVYKLDISSGNVTRLTNDPAQDALATISPDGKSVAFLSNRGGGLAVWYVSIEGGEAKKMFDIKSDWGNLSGDGWSEERLSWGK